MRHQGIAVKGHPTILRSSSRGNQLAFSASQTPVASFLKDPSITIRIGEVGEARVVSASKVKTGCETSVPGSNWRLVPDLADVDPTFEQSVACGLEVVDHKIDVAK